MAQVDKMFKVTVYNSWTLEHLWNKFFYGHDAEERAEAYCDNYFNDELGYRSTYEPA